MSFTQTSISQRRGRETARPRAGLASDLAATASLVLRPQGRPGTRLRQSVSAGTRPVAPMAYRITDLAVLELIGSTHPRVPL
jgi:hypothetical protein